MSRIPGSGLLLTLLLVFVGVATGVFVGAELFGPPTLSGLESSSASPLTSATNFLTLGIGDAFPLAGFRDSLGRELAPKQLLSDNGTILLFVGPGCRACLDLLKLWQKEAGPLIGAEASVFACVPPGEDLSPEFSQLLASHKVVHFDATRLGAEINLSFWPTTIGIDPGGKIGLAIEGFTNDIVYRLAAWQNELERK